MEVFQNNELKDEFINIKNMIIAYLINNNMDYYIYERYIPFKF